MTVCSTRPRIRTLALVLGSLVVASALAPTPASAGSFQVRCRQAHRRYDDPIVSPGQPGHAHRHDFYGARHTTANSTYQTMVNDSSTCTDQFDTAGYWQPVLYVDNRPVRGHVVAYYSLGRKGDARPFPANLRMIAGNSMAKRAQSKNVVFWRCVGKGSHKKHSYIPSCPRGTQLSAWIMFPDCWNGVDKDSANHKSHVRYASKGKCPDGFQHPLPKLKMAIVWPVRPHHGHARLASGSGLTLHGDFWNTWHQGRLRRLTNECLLLTINCGVVHARR
jgi:hypothetical protein